MRKTKADVKCVVCKDGVDTECLDEFLIITNDLGDVVFYHKKCFEVAPPVSDVFPDYDEDIMSENRRRGIELMQYYAENEEITGEERSKLELIISRLMELDKRSEYV